MYTSYIYIYITTSLVTLIVSATAEVPVGHQFLGRQVFHHGAVQLPGEKDAAGESPGQKIG